MRGYKHLTSQHSSHFVDPISVGLRQSASFAGVAVLFLCTTVAAGCNSQQATAPRLHYVVTFDPSPPKVGPAKVSVAVTDVAGQPVEGAEVRVEGNMNHAGMKPSFADLHEEQPGQYVGTLTFTMGGDWFLLITTTTGEGAKSEHQVDVPGVQSR